MMFQLYPSTCLLVCGWNSLVVGGIIQSSALMTLMKFDMNCALLSISIVDGKLKFDIKWSSIIVATAIAGFRAVGIAFVTSE